MAELPEIMNLSKQMNEELKSKEFETADIIQEKCLNIDKKEFKDIIQGKKIKRIYNKGKWIFIELSEDYYLLLNLGMGADILYYRNEEFNEEHQCKFHFMDNSGFTCKFWWFGRAELLNSDEIKVHKSTKDIAISPLEKEFTKNYFIEICKGRAGIKNFLLNQKVGGIGNVYIHDILFKAKLHPKTPLNSLSNAQIVDLYKIIKENLSESYEKKGLAYEKDFYGNEGKFTREYFLVDYREGEKCPQCGTTIEKIKTGNTSSYICPQCQKLDIIK